MDKLKRLLELSEGLKGVFDKAENRDIAVNHKLLHERLQNPKSFVSLIGETSSGKSTIINGLIRQNLLPTAARPTTGTVTQIQCAEVGKNNFYKITSQGEIKTIDNSEFIELAKKPTDDIKYLFVETEAPKADFQGFLIVDTPGFNSILKEHEEVLENFLPQSDVIIFTVTYKDGFLQPNQDFMKLIFDLLEEDEKMPIFLVINRCRDSVTLNDARVQEIMKNAFDTMHRPLKTYLIRNVEKREDEVSVFPKAKELWEDILQIANSDERKEQIVDKSKYLLISLIEDMQMECEKILKATKVSSDNIVMLENYREQLKKTLQKNFQLIENSLRKLKRELRKFNNRNTELTIRKIEFEVNDSNKWLDKEECSAFIMYHRIRQDASSTMEEIGEQARFATDKLSEQLEERIILTISNIKEMASKAESKEFSNLMDTSITAMLDSLTWVSTYVALSLLGGVGGVAAGAGNLTKMIVSQAGKLVGKTFHRQLYNEIGKTFTKRFITRVSVAIYPIIEGIEFIKEASSWQKELILHSKKILDEWIKEFDEELNSYILKLEKNMKHTQMKIFEQLDNEILKDINVIKNKISLSEENNLLQYIDTLKKYRGQIDLLK